MTEASAIPDHAKFSINQIIMNDEGGWVLTNNPNDQDGGWTYAGVTATVFNRYLKDNNIPTATYEQVKASMGVDVDDWKVYVYDIYYKNYYLPLCTALDLHEDDGLIPCELSCAINCGVSTAANIAKELIVSGVYNPSSNAFCHHWLLYYAGLVKGNATAWHDLAKHLQDSKNPIPNPMPADTNRSLFLEGWINRVFKYIND